MVIFERSYIESGYRSCPLGRVVTMGARRIGRNHVEDLQRRVAHLEMAIMAPLLNWYSAEGSAMESGTCTLQAGQFEGIRAEMLLEAEVKTLQKENAKLKEQINKLLVRASSVDAVVHLRGTWEVLEDQASNERQIIEGTQMEYEHEDDHESAEELHAGVFMAAATEKQQDSQLQTPSLKSVVDSCFEQALNKFAKSLDMRLEAKERKRRSKGIGHEKEEQPCSV